MIEAIATGDNDDPASTRAIVQDRNRDDQRAGNSYLFQLSSNSQDTS